MSTHEQLKLELPGTHYSQEISWYVGRQTESWNWLGKKVIKKEMMRDDEGRLITTSIRADQISELKDPDLRYALRFEAAAKSNPIEEPYGTSHHLVAIEATDEGIDSKFIGATYTGVGKGDDNTFLRDLHRAAPNKQ